MKILCPCTCIVLFKKISIPCTKPKSENVCCSSLDRTGGAQCQAFLAESAETRHENWLTWMYMNRQRSLHCKLLASAVFCYMLIKNFKQNMNWQHRYKLLKSNNTCNIILVIDLCSATLLFPQHVNLLVSHMKSMKLFFDYLLGTVTSLPCIYPGIFPQMLVN